MKQKIQDYQQEKKNKNLGLFSGKNSIFIFLPLRNF